MLKKSFHWSFSKLIHLWSDSLYRNSLWLMAGSFSMAGIGFFYWIIATRLYSPAQIGLAATLLSVVSLINGFAVLGFNITLIRYLPTSTEKEKNINTAFTVVFIAALAMGLIYLIGLPIWTPKLMFIRASIPALLITIIFFPVNTINGITDYVFTAFRKAHWVFVSNITQSIIKLIALILLSTLGAWGVIGSNIIAAFVAVTLCIILITTRFGINFRPTIDRTILTKVRKFAFGNYLSNMIGSLPTMILPIIITNRISPEQTAYYYMPTMIASILMVVPSMVSRSYFTESSHVDKPISMKKPVFVTYLILIPTAIVLIVLGHLILNFFGHKYSSEGYNYFVLIIISVLVSVLNYFLSSKFMVQKKMGTVIILNTLGSTIYISTILILIPLGISGIGLATIIAHIVIISIYLLISQFSKHSNYA